MLNARMHVVFLLLGPLRLEKGWIPDCSRRGFDDKILYKSLVSGDLNQQLPAWHQGV